MLEKNTRQWMPGFLTTIHNCFPMVDAQSATALAVGFSRVAVVFPEGPAKRDEHTKCSYRTVCYIHYSSHHRSSDGIPGVFIGV